MSKEKIVEVKPKEKNLFSEEFNMILIQLKYIPDADRERLLKAAIKFFGLDHILSSECRY